MRGNRLSLHIGVNGYPTAFRSLAYCANDALALRATLDAHREGFDSTESELIADLPPAHPHAASAKSPSRSNIIAGLGRLCEASSDDLVVFQFCGHGALDSTGHLFLLPNDVVAGDIAETGISWQRLIAKLEGCKASRKIVIIDACHSGAGRSTDEARHVSSALSTAMSQPTKGIVYLSACSGDQVAYEVKELGHGLFSYYLVQGVNGAADPLQRGRVDVAALFNYVNDKTSEHAKRFGAVQTPMLHSKVARPLEEFLLSAIVLDEAPNNILVLSSDPVIGRLTETGLVCCSRGLRCTWKHDVKEVTETARTRFDFDAVYVDVEHDWPNVKSFISLIRERYPIVPFVLIGRRRHFLYSLNPSDRSRFSMFFFFDTDISIAAVRASITATLSQTKWDIAIRYGERQSN